MRAARRLFAIGMLATVAAARPAGAGDSADASAGPLSSWVRMLASTDPATRGDARDHLLGLTVDELSALGRAARQGAPLSAEQSLGLQEIVRYVMTRAALQRLPATHKGLLGVRWRASEDLLIDTDLLSDPAGGASIDVLLPGFVGYRYLKSGDRVVGLSADGLERPVHTNGDLRRLIQHQTPGDRITLCLIRNGQALAVTLLLDSRPDLGDDTDPTAAQLQLDDVLNTAASSAQAYFGRVFSDTAAGDA